jgi:hypothetical protein
MEKDTENMYIEEFPLQKWVCIIIIMEDLKTDIYIDGTFTQSKKTKYIPIMTDDGKLHIAKENGFKGTLNKLTYFNYILSRNEINKFYKSGPNI